jgi:hypothetical protein
VLIVAMLSGLLSSPFSIFFQSLILFVLSADTKTQISSQSQATSGGRLVRLRSWQGKKTEGSSSLSRDSLPTTLQEDFGKLLTQLRFYRSRLRENEIEEFKCKSLAIHCFLFHLSPLPFLPFFLVSSFPLLHRLVAWGEYDDDWRNAISTTTDSMFRRNLFGIFKYFSSKESNSPAQNILFELGNVRQIITREITFFNHPLVAEDTKRKRLNLLFMKDLLDGVNGMILDHKDRCDNEMKDQVEGWKKFLASFILIISSIGMLTYVYLFAMRQSTNRQHAWFNSFQIWLFFEIFVISTGLVLVEHVIIPLWSLKEVQRVKERVVLDILLFQKKMKASKNKIQASMGASKDLLSGGGHRVQSKSQIVNPTRTAGVLLQNDLRFNAAEFLYPSYRIAQLFPQYPESQVILQYQTPWPKKSLKKREKSTKKRYDKRFEFLPKTIARIGVFSLSTLIQLPPSMQEMGIQMILLTLVGYVAKFHLFLFKINPVLTLAPVFLLVTVIHLFFFSGKKIRPSRTYPLGDEVEEKEEEEKKDPPEAEDSSSDEDLLLSIVPEEEDKPEDVRALLNSALKSYFLPPQSSSSSSSSSSSNSSLRSIIWEDADDDEESCQFNLAEYSRYSLPSSSSLCVDSLEAPSISLKGSSRLESPSSSDDISPTPSD